MTGQFIFYKSDKLPQVARLGFRFGPTARKIDERPRPRGT
jgi:hypothetical protein